MKKFICMILTCSLLLSVLMPAITNAAAYAESTDNIQSFEGGVPDYWAAQTGSLETSAIHFKHQGKSLLWNWKSNDIITVTGEKNLLQAGKNSSGGMILWVYNEQPLEDKIVFNFGTQKQIADQNPLYTFDCYLNFKGWRAIWIRFRNDAVNANFEGAKTGDLEQMQIIAPSTQEEGQLYFDLLEFRNTVYWDRSQDYQVPVKRVEDEKGQTWQRNYYYMQKTPYLSLETITQEQKDAFEIVDERLQDWINGTGKYTNEPEWQARKRNLDNYIKNGVNQYNSLNIQKDENGNITGKPLFSNVSPYIDAGTTFGRGVAVPIFLPLALDYKMNGNQASLDKAMDLFDYYYDQGWAEGSGIGSLNHETLRSTGYFITVYLLKEELRQTGRLERELGSIDWYSTFGKLYVNPEIEYEETTADELRTQSLNRLIYVLLQENTDEKVRDMKSYVTWLEEAIRVNPNLSDTIKPDFMGYHHQAPYMNAYAPHGYHLVAVINYLLHDTIFALNNKAQYNLKQALITHDILSNEIEVPFALRGRIVSSVPISITILPAYAYMALSGNPETGEAIDTEMAGIFLKNWNIDETTLKNNLINKCAIDISYVNTMGAIEPMLDLVKSNIPIAEEQQGVWSKPYAGLAVQRKNQWMSAVKGWSKYIWDYEASAKENIYGRYMSYGAVQIYSKGNPITDKANGYDYENGWDWNRIPGATTKHLELAELSSKNNGDIHRSYSDQSFLGSVTLNDQKSGHAQANNIMCAAQEGAWAMSLHDTIYDTSFYAKKSVFFFDDVMVLLGSNINNNDSSNNTETTLFQSNMNNNKSMPVYINSQTPVTQYPYNQEWNEADRAWLVDPYGNGYYIPNAKDVKMTRNTQTSKDNTDKKVTTGEYTTAWIDHGTAPTDGEYEYAIKVDTTPEEMQDYANHVSYEVLQKDENAHIVKSIPSGTVGYAIFKENEELTDTIIKKSDTPILAMIKQKDDEMLFSVSDPDLRISNTADSQASVMKKVKVELNGRWNLKENTNDIKILEKAENKTTVEVNCIDGKTVQALLEKEERYHTIEIINAAGTVTGAGTYAYSDTATVTAAGNDDYTFDYWQEGDEIVSCDASYTFTVTGDTTLTAQFKPAKADTYDVIFKDINGVVLATIPVKAGSTLNEADIMGVAHPTKPGRLFDGWDKTFPLTVNEKTMVTAKYKIDPTTAGYTVIANGTTVAENVPFDTKVTVTAPAANSEGKAFSYWQDENHKIVSYHAAYTFYMSNNVALTAVYGASTPVLPVVKTDNVIIDTVNSKMSFISRVALPDGYTMVECGTLIYDKNEAFDINTTGVRKIQARTQTPAGQYMASLTNVAMGNTRYARGYLVYKGIDGTMATVYGDIVSGTLTASPASDDIGGTEEFVTDDGLSH